MVSFTVSTAMAATISRMARAEVEAGVVAGGADAEEASEAMARSYDA
jgi:hypothetical protein